MQKKNKAVIGLLSAATLASYFILPQGLSFEEARRDGTKRAAYVESVERRFHLDDLPNSALSTPRNVQLCVKASFAVFGLYARNLLFRSKSTIRFQLRLNQNSNCLNLCQPDQLRGHLPPPDQTQGRPLRR